MAKSEREAMDQATVQTNAELGKLPGWSRTVGALVFVPVISVVATSFAGMSQSQQSLAVSWTTLLCVGAVWLFERSQRKAWWRRWNRNLEAGISHTQA